MAGILRSGQHFFETHDPVCEGPLVPGEFGGTPARARWIARAWDLPEETCLERMRAHQRLHVEAQVFDEVCLWFEHDLFDQASLVELLARWYATPESVDLRGRLSLVTLDRHPSVEHFVGLGQLRPEAFPELFAGRVRICLEDFELAAHAWEALCGQDPQAVAGLGTSPAFPFLPDAMARHLAELPSVEGGVGLTEQLVLERLSQGACLAVECFQWWMHADPQPWLGDVMFWARLHGMARGPAPLIDMDGDFPGEQLTITELGRAVATGQEDWLAHATPETWEGRAHRGGLRVHPSRPHWRRSSGGAPVHCAAV